MGRVRHNRASSPSQRCLRVGELVRHILSESVLRYDFSRCSLSGLHLSINEVRVSPDLSHANVYVTSLEGVLSESQLKDLNVIGHSFRKSLSGELQTKSVPQLHFVSDVSVENSRRIDELLSLPSVVRDLEV